MRRGETMASGLGEKWLLASFKPVTLFSLRMSIATSSAAKTLLVPTPYSFKLAMVDAAFRAGGEASARGVLNSIKGAEVRFRPPEHAVVTNTFVKIRRQPKTPTPEKPYISSIAFREFCFYLGILEVAICVTRLEPRETQSVVHTLRHINYLGKRGSLCQFMGVRNESELPLGFTAPIPGEVPDFSSYRVTQFLDELVEVDSEDLFERINTYSGTAIGKHRVVKPYLLPYRVESTSKGYTHYVRRT
jgi:hypothetical protein